MIEHFQHATRAAHRKLAHGIGGGVQGRLRDHLGGIQRRRVLRPHRQVVPGMTGVRRVDARGLDQRRIDRHAVVHEFYGERVGKPLDRVLGRRVRALKWEGALRPDTADVDQRAAALAQVLESPPGSRAPCPGSWSRTPAAGLRSAPFRCGRRPTRRDCSPGIEAAEAVERDLGDPSYVSLLGDVRDHAGDLTAISPDDIFDVR
jgi:hypothetical protein